MELRKPMGRPPLTGELGFTEDERRELIGVALSLRAMRLSYEDIAKRFAVRASTIRRWVHQELALRVSEDELSAKELRQLELQELDHLQAVLAPNVEEGQLGAINTVLKISESRRRLLGIDQPESHELNISVREIVGVNPDDI